jgi:hypothetical protein
MPFLRDYSGCGVKLSNLIIPIVILYIIHRSDVPEAGFCLHLQVKPTHMDPPPPQKKNWPLYQDHEKRSFEIRKDDG